MTDLQHQLDADTPREGVRVESGIGGQRLLGQRREGGGAGDGQAPGDPAGGVELGRTVDTGRVDQRHHIPVYEQVGSDGVAVQQHRLGTHARYCGLRGSGGRELGPFPHRGSHLQARTEEVAQRGDADRRGEVR